jgi:hypothetical protein
MGAYSDEQLPQMASRWMPDLKNARKLKVHTTADDYFQVE